MDSKGCLKLGDFGLAKYFGSPNRAMTHVVVTRWYRSPELLFGAKSYGVGVDIWAVGCILAELLLRVPFLAGDSDLDQLSKIFQALGTPSEETWPGISSLPDFIQFKQQPGTPLRDIFTAAGDDLLDLMGSLLMLCPLKRCDATTALKYSAQLSCPPLTHLVLSGLPTSQTNRHHHRELVCLCPPISSRPRKTRFYVFSVEGSNLFHSRRGRLSRGSLKVP